MESKLDWNDYDGDAELARVKRKAKATLALYLEHFEWDDGREGQLVFEAVMVLRDELLAWARAG
jgi:hypothetical protein